jgi:hypothetical protein
VDTNRLIAALLLVRLGQELGTHSRLARLVADLIDTLFGGGFPNG